MKERIKSYIDYKGISAGDLATSLDVQRSNISHVLNGRNKPGASFIQKLLTTYPDLNARWLLIGEGEMLLQKSEDLLREEPVTMPRAACAPVIEEKKDLFSSVEKKISKSGPAIDRIVLLYTDGTFSTFSNK